MEEQVSKEVKKIVDEMLAMDEASGAKEVVNMKQPNKGHELGEFLRKTESEFKKREHELYEVLFE